MNNTRLTRALTLKNNMAKETFTTKPYTFKILSAVFALSSILFPFILKIGGNTYLFAILCVVMAILYWNIPPQIIVIDESGIRKQQYGLGTGLFARLVQPDIECEWNRIRSVSTRRLSGGSFLTSISIFEEDISKAKNNVTIASSLFKDSVSILKLIKAHASQARFDETTEMIINDQADIRSIRPVYWILFGIVVLATFLYRLYRKG